MKKKKGFTLIELVVVMAIIAVLALLVVGAIIAARRTATATTNRGNAKTIQTAAEALYAKNKSYSALGTATSQSFATAASTLGGVVGTVTLAPSACDSVTAYAGGGRVTYNATTGVYTIIPVDHNCAASGEMTGGDVVTLQ